MQDRYAGDIADFGKLALLRCLMEGRRLAVCWYLTNGEANDDRNGKSLDYLRRPAEFRHLAPEIFDALSRIFAENGEARSVAAIQDSGLLPNAVFHRTEVPRALAVRREWSEELVATAGDVDLVFLDPDNGLQGIRLTPKHVALAEFESLRRPDRTLVFAQRQSGRHSQVNLLARKLRSVGCRRVEVVRFRLITPRLYVVTDHDGGGADRIMELARKWGRWIETYRF
jgi:hypothetical protein